MGYFVSNDITRNERNKILLNGAYRVNAMCSLYNDIHDTYEICCIILSVLSAVVLSLEVIHPYLPGTAGTGRQVIVSLYRPRDLPTR